MTQLVVTPAKPHPHTTQVGPLPDSTVPPWANQVRFAVVAAEFGLLVWIIRLVELESARFGDLVLLAWAGFVIHHFLPLRLKLPFFVVLSLAGLRLVAGGTVALCVTGVGLTLIAICHLPIPFILRIGFLLLAGAVLAAFRAEWLMGGSGLNSAAWMILGSMFMFRLIVYLYDLRHEAAPFGSFRAMAYFFLLPNVCFPLFPLVDYKTFCNTYFNGPPLRIYQSGLRWMARGVFQLMLYRAVYQLALVDPFEATDLGGVARFMLATYFLYLRVSGTFHLIVGLLHLFGFNLPETHHLYLLSSSFTDYWRRINIYWKDFVTKIFFYPTYFKLKRLGPTWALALATLVAFFFTWLLHSYQWFWLRGSMVLTWQDGVFWGVLGGLVLINVLYETKYGRRRALTGQVRTVWSQAGLALRTIGTFLTICIVWTIWSVHSVEELSWLARSATHVTPSSVALILAGLAALGVAAVILGHFTSQRTEVGAGKHAQPFSWRSALATGLVGCGLLAAATLSGVTALEGTEAGAFLAAISQDQLNQMDIDSRRRGYYEELDVTRQDEKLAFLRAPLEPKRDPGNLRFQRSTGDFLITQLIPGSGPQEFHGKPVTINRWGMRDRDYEKTKPPGICRIALFGSSHEFGSGVANHETFENLVEDRLNLESARTAYEILNFAEPGYSIFQYLAVLENRALDFEPDAVFLVVNVNEIERTLEHGAKVLHSGYAIPYDILSNVALEEGVEQSMSEAQIRSRLRPHAPQIVAWAYQRIAAECRRHGAALYIVFRPSPILWSQKGAAQEAGARRLWLEIAEELQVPVLDLSAAFEGVKNRRTLIVAPSDDHTNAQGHRLLADELYKQMHDREGNLLLRPHAPVAKP